MAFTGMYLVIDIQLVPLFIYSGLKFMFKALPGLLTVDPAAPEAWKILNNITAEAESSGQIVRYIVNIVLDIPKEEIPAFIFSRQRFQEKTQVELIFFNVPIDGSRGMGFFWKSSPQR